MDIGQILARGYAQDTALDRRQKLAETLLGLGQRAQSPLVSALSGFVGAYQMGNIAREQGEKERKIEEQAAQTPTVPFEGTSMDAQVYNILLDPSKRGTPAYQAAYDYASQAKVLPDGTRIEPNLRFLKTLDSQTGQPAGALNTEPPPVRPGNLPSQADKSTLREVQTGSQVIKNELKKFGEAIDKANDADFAAAAAGGITEGGQSLVGAWTTTALSAKGKALLDLGVLNGPDLDVIQGMLPNPGTAAGAFATKAAYKKAVQNVNNFIDNRVKEYEARYGNPKVEAIDETEVILPNTPPGYMPLPPIINPDKPRLTPDQARAELKRRGKI